MITAAAAIAIKPHHFVDILTALGTGQTRFEPHPYGHDVHRIAAVLLRHPDARLRLELGADDICVPCCHNRAGQCDDTIDTSWRPAAPRSKREWNLRLDQRWCARLRLDPGAQLTGRELANRIRELAGDLAGIYPEIPAERTATRAADLSRGLERFLGADPPAA